MATKPRKSPQCYNEDGLPIYYNVFDEKSGMKLHMSFRLPKEKVGKGECEYGKIVYEETHKFSIDENESEVAAVQKALRAHSPDFWRCFFESKGSSLFLNSNLDRQKGLPLAVAWDIDEAELAKQLSWLPKTLKRKRDVAALMLKQGWGSVGIGELNANRCGEIFMTVFSAEQHRAAVSLLKQLASHEIGHKRLQDNPWPKRNSVRRKALPKKSSTCVNAHIRTDSITQKQVRVIVDEMVEMLKNKDNIKCACSLLLCLTMGISVQEQCYIQLGSIKCGAKGLPLSLHISGTTRRNKKRNESVEYQETDPKNRIIPIPSKIAAALQPLMQEWKEQMPEEEFATRYLLAHDKNEQRRSDPKDLEKWINEYLKPRLKDKRMYDGQVNEIRNRLPYRRCLSTAKQSLFHAGFEEDELRYFLGLSASSTAGEFYCDFVNSGEMQRMRGILDRWLGSPKHTETCNVWAMRNPAAGTEVAFGEESKTTCVLLEIDIPVVPDGTIPENGYEVLFWANRGLFLSARALPMIKEVQKEEKKVGRKKGA